MTVDHESRKDCLKPSLREAMDMAILLSRLKAACHGWARFPPLTPAVGGLALVVIALAAQSYASYIRWLEYEKRGKWRAETTLDFATCGRYEMTFRPIVSRNYAVRLMFRTPPEGDLTPYADTAQPVQARSSRQFRSTGDYAVSWQITCEDKAAAHGRINSLESAKWTVQGNAHCRYAPDRVYLQAGKEYTLAAQVEHVDPAVTELSPLLQVHTWGSLKGRRLGDWRPRHTFMFCAIGSAFLLMAYMRHVYDSKPSPPA